MTHYLVIHVRLHEGRYHGAGAWPPSPSRLFQALIAGAGLSGPLHERDRLALEWLEALEAPTIGAPQKRQGQSVKMWVPGNDLDGVGGDPGRIAAIRAEKNVTPQLFDAAIPFFYAWAVESVDGNGKEAHRICTVADRLYQFGRGVDFAWAWGDLMDSHAYDGMILTYQGRVLRPSTGAGGAALPCPSAGSFQSLERRYAAFSRRFATEAGKRVFSRAPPARFASVSYDSPPARHLFELREQSSEASLAPLAPTRASSLVTALRDAAVARLHNALPTHRADTDRVLVGRKADGSNDGPTSARVRIIPLPSIGNRHADRLVRRVVIEVPADCSLRADDVRWAFSGLEVAEEDRRDVPGVALTPTQDVSMLAHYGLDGEGLYRRWRTVSPAALPARSRGRARGGKERMGMMGDQAGAVLQALRHAGVGTEPVSISVRREPFDGGDDRAEAFASGTRFGKDRLWHVELGFSDGIGGPLVIGDGRFLGLGLMAPVPGPKVPTGEDHRTSED